MKSPLRTYTAILMAMIFWAVSFVWFKMANEAFRPITIVFFRLIISALLLSIYLFATKRFVKIKKEDRKLFLILTLFEPFFYFLGESFGLTYVSATTGSVLISTIPVIATLGAWLLFRERLRLINYAGIIISFIGILVFILDSEGSLSFNNKGLALMTLAVFSAVGYNLTLSRLVGSYNPVFIVNVQNIFGALLFLPLFLISDLKHLVNEPFSFRHFIPVAELAIFASSAAFILFAFSIRNLGISRANIFTNCIPLFTALFAFILLKEKLVARNIAGMAIVITGLFMSQINNRRKKIDDALALTGKTA